MVDKLLLVVVVVVPDVRDLFAMSFVCLSTPLVVDVVVVVVVVRDLIGERGVRVDDTVDVFDKVELKGRAFDAKVLAGFGAAGL